MIYDLGTSVALLVYAAFAFGIAGFLARDELVLRLLMLAASLFYIAYYALVAASPLWDPILTNTILALVNLTVIAVVVVERTTFSMSRDAAVLYRSFSNLSPGQFRRLLKAGETQTAAQDSTIVVFGEPVSKLYYVIDGPVTIERDHQSTDIDGGIFIGEIAWLTGEAASATVKLKQGARYLSWDHDVLEALGRRAPGLRVALTAHLNFDLARKLSRSVPVSPS